jgi:very-short-patch-repair endonuclease
MADTTRAHVLRKKETWAEKLMWRWLRDRRFSGYKFRRQHPKGIYCLDFFCEEASLAIELDGSGHGHPGQQSHDAEREKFLTSQGIKVLRFWNSHLRRNTQSIRDTIFEELQRRSPHPLPDYTRPINKQ